MSFPTHADIERAIGIVEDSLDTHVRWAKWRREGHDVDEDHDLIGDLAHHETAIADYEHVVDVLKSMLP